MKLCIKMQTPIGVLWVEQTDDAISMITYNKPDCTEQTSELLQKTCIEIKDYFNGNLKKFTVPLFFNSTPFNQKVWQELLKIPYGKTCSYSDIAARIGHPKACRAVGLANNRNPIPIIVPCHRVVGKNGSLTGYAYGLDIKSQLLKLEADNVF